MTVTKTDDAITYPLIGRGFPETGSSALMVSSRRDLESFCGIFQIAPQSYYPLFMSRLYTVYEGSRRFSLVGPVVGAPYAAILMETLAASGTTRFLWAGWCGAVSTDVKTGDFIVPIAAIVDEGTSRHYGVDFSSVVTPSDQMVRKIKETLTSQGLAFHEGPVWTTDAIFRETAAAVRRFQSLGALAVEMESSALFAVAKYRKLEVGSLLVVSDELSSLTWKPGLKHPLFIQNRLRMCNVMGALCQKI